MSIRKRIPIGRGRNTQDRELTRCYLPVPAVNRLLEHAGPRGRSQWVSRAIDYFEQVPARDRNVFLLHDVIVRGGLMRSTPIRLSAADHFSVKRIIRDFHKHYPAQSIDKSGVIRAAVLYRLREELGLLSLGPSQKS